MTEKDVKRTVDTDDGRELKNPELKKVVGGVTTPEIHDLLQNLPEPPSLQANGVVKKPVFGRRK